MKKFRVIIQVLLLITFLHSNVCADTYKGTSYSIKSKVSMGSAKCMIDIMLEQKVAKDFLRDLATTLQQQEPHYQRMFITYYLPGVQSGSGAWATSHFNPNLDVKILGTSLEEEQALAKQSANTSGEMIGKWADDSPYSGGVCTIVKKNGKVFMVREFKDGSRSEKEMIQKKQAGKMRYEKKEGTSTGDYYLIESSGRLGVYDNIGFIDSMRPI